VDDLVELPIPEKNGEGRASELRLTLHGERTIPR
jgi:hypothetical protein